MPLTHSIAMKRRSHEQPAGRECQRRQVVARALGDQEVGAHAYGCGQGQQRADQVERRAGDVDDEHQADDRHRRSGPAREREGARRVRTHAKPDEQHRARGTG